MGKHIQDYLQTLPPVSREVALQAWQALPDDLHSELDLNINTISNLVQGNPLVIADILEMVKKQAGPAFNPLSRIAIVGPVNVGKSTLFNAILANLDIRAEVSPVPGTTVVPQEGSVGAFSIIDTPGLDNSRQEGINEQNIALEQARQADFLLVVFDASRGITASDAALYQDLLVLQKPHLILLNKIDLIPKKQLQAVIKSASLALNQTEELINTASALNKDGVYELILKIAAVEPRLLGELGKTIAPLRRRLSWQAIRRSAIASAAVALTPLPIVDFIPLTAIQCTLVLTLARIHDIPITLGRAKELIAAFGVGYLARTTFAELSKMVAGPLGWAVSVSVAAAYTVIIGYSAMMWFDLGIKPSKEATQKLISSISETIANVLKSIANRKNKESIKEAVNQALEHATTSLDKNYEETKTKHLNGQDLPEEVSRILDGQAKS
ncbi:50S ribosome-binding GTPase [bacterium]|nr:50S ribosome-binding GTPase [bacterium]